MNIIWILHGIEMLLIVGLFLWWLFDRRKIFQIFNERHLNAYLKVLETRIENQRHEWLSLHNQIELYLKSLDRICSKASQLLEKSSFVITPSLEESELKASVIDEKKIDKPPFIEPELGLELEPLIDNEKFLKEQLF